jgi:hypothetical protein
MNSLVGHFSPPPHVKKVEISKCGKKESSIIELVAPPATLLFSGCATPIIRQLSIPYNY